MPWRAAACWRRWNVTLDSLVGHERTRGLLASALESGRMPPSLLFTGPRGVGKRTLAMAVGRALVCRERGGPCGSCGPCHRARSGGHADLIVLEAETKVIKIDQVRDLAREILSRPFEARARAFIVDEAERFTDQAANALLKSLEEPPPTSHVFLITAAPQALLPTIRSRCQVFRFGPLGIDQLEAELVRRGIDPGEARLRAVASGGSLGDALELESDAYMAFRDELLAQLESLDDGGALATSAMAERLAEQDDPEAALLLLRSLLRDVEAFRAGGEADLLFNRDLATRLQGLARAPFAARAAELAEWCGETIVSLRGNAAKLLAMDLVAEAASGGIETEEVVG